MKSLYLNGDSVGDNEPDDMKLPDPNLPNEDDDDEDDDDDIDFGDDDDEDDTN